jgi:hypothetical protein
LLDAIPDRFLTTLELVLGDLQRPEPIALLCGWDGHYVQIREPAFSGGYSWRPSEEQLSSAEMAVEMAEGLQEQFFWESAGAWAQPRPACPGHRHPAVPELVDGNPWWMCPAEGNGVAPFGEAN